jgi:hypothetical protein
MSLNTTLVVSALTAYVDQITAKEFITEAVFSQRTSNIIRVISGIKGTQALNLYENTQSWKAASCGLINPAGTNTLKQTNITVYDLMNESALCQVGANSLSKYWTGVLQPKGINQTEPTPKEFADAFYGMEIAKTGEFIEYNTWLGSTGTQSFNSASLSENLTLTNGLLYQLNYGTLAASVISSTASGGVALTSGNAISVVNSMIAKLPQEIAGKKLGLFCSFVNYQTIKNALLDKQTFNSVFFVKDEKGENIPWAFNWPYMENITIYAIPGLIGRNDLILTMPENLIMGRDGETDEETFDVWHSKEYNAIMGRTMIRIGTAVAQPQYVVMEKAPLA